MLLKDLLLHKAEAGDFVIFFDGGWYQGCTIIDHEDLFISSLNPTLLKREVESYEYNDKDYKLSNAKTLEVNLK